MATSFKRLWTVCVIPYEDADPFVDLIYCDQQPTPRQIANIHSHLEQWLSDDHQWIISEYTKPDNAPRIPSIL